METVVTPELLDEISLLLPDVAWKSTVPIFVILGETLAPHATGTLLRIAEAHFLVTAAHVLETAEKYKAEIAVGVIGNAHPLKIAGASFKSTDDALDVAIWRLSDKSVEFLSANTFLQLRDIRTPDRFDDDFYFVCGFPCEHSNSSSSTAQRATVQPFQFCTTLFNGDIKATPGFNADLHVLLDGARDHLHKGTGADVAFPNRFNGMSGCPIWKAQALGVPRESWKPGQAKLVAVQTCAYPNHKVHRILRGTTWKAVGSLIVAVYPELRPSFDLYYR
jgi:hypothetical protein